MRVRFTRRLAGFVPLLLLSLGCGSSSSGGTPASSPPPAQPSYDLRLASTPWVPFTGDEKQPRVALYLVESALERAGYAATTSIVPDGALTGLLRDGKFDGSAALWTAEDRETFLLYSKPYLENRLVLVGRKGSDVSAGSLKELGGKRIGVVEGYAYGKQLDEARELSLVRGKSSEDNLRALAAGQVDYILLDALLVEYLFEQQPKRAIESLEVGKTPLIKRTLHFGVRKALPNAQQIIDRFNNVLASMMRDGSYHLALQVSWITADVDGDGRDELVGVGPAVGAAPPSRSYQLFEEAALAPPPAQQPGARPPGTSQVGSNGPTEQRRYYVGGRVYESWSEVPESFKIQPGANTTGGGHATVKLLEW
ncbi:MAG TPA: transporter substrate-binding domain-containing protein [Polyangiaceae bacterium]